MNRELTRGQSGTASGYSEARRGADEMSTGERHAQTLLFETGLSTVLPPMNSWTEGALALLVVVGLGIGLFLFTGESIGDGGGATGTTQPMTVDSDAAARGETLAEGQGCLQCHTTDGRPGSGPTWKGLAGSSRPLASGDQVVANDSYLFSSIVDPNTQVVEGFDSIMPTFYEDQLDEQQITDLVEYIKSLAS